MKKFYTILALALVSVMAWAEVSITITPNVIDFGTVAFDENAGSEDSIAFTVTYSGLQEYCGVYFDFEETPGEDAAFWISGTNMNGYIYGGDAYTAPEGNDLKVHFYATAAGNYTAKVAFYSYEDYDWTIESEKVYMNISVKVVDQATGIDNTQAAPKARKQVIDGQLYIVRGEHLYDMTGAQVR